MQDRVVGIADGDTLTVLDSAKQQHKIRIAGIDAPEKRQAYGERSRQHLASLAFQKSATLDCYKVDRYKRQVCRVWVDRQDVGLAQVSSGLGWHYKEYQREPTSKNGQPIHTLKTMPACPDWGYGRIINPCRRGL